jgi:hypothetical protein
MACNRSAGGVMERPLMDAVLVIDGFLDKLFILEGKDRISVC